MVSLGKTCHDVNILNLNKYDAILKLQLFIGLGTPIDIKKLLSTGFNFIFFIKMLSKACTLKLLMHYFPLNSFEV